MRQKTPDKCFKAKYLRQKNIETKTIVTLDPMATFLKIQIACCIINARICFPLFF